MREREDRGDGERPSPAASSPRERRTGALLPELPPAALGRNTNAVRCRAALPANDDVLSYFATGAFNVVTGANTGKGFSFTGGTGRFTNAQGSGSTAFVFDESGDIVGLRQTGMISYEASDRSG